jgi:UDP:flavonoid glycosyltransferase YjiC (YdhE family)
MILSGEGQDKPQSGGVCNYTGVGKYYPVSVLTPELVAKSVDEVLGDPTYSEKAKRMEAACKRFDPHARLDQMVREYMKTPAVV